ncbi:hypothetical protein DK847_16535 [Aestuariivirga litoralis]|uniref:Uncharacterized protein n=1 Tax=Aestuariivirga litoralis TaxID=2650924 RepID=A0A2W2B6Y4_9HYPH|nr:hypothetical protein [Aestuariivirga litoralis]PZF75828.1 hypothetical protein DK847_16535 [Aestuariivirga litoralis]
MAWKLEQGLRLTIKVTPGVRSQHESGEEGWDACDEMLPGIQTATNGQSKDFALGPDDLVH